MEICHRVNHEMLPEAVARGEPSDGVGDANTDCLMAAGVLQPIHEWVAHSRVIRAEAATRRGRTAAELEGRRVMLRLLKLLRRQPGLANLTVAWCAPEVGVREPVTIQGRATITAHDYESGRHWPDAVCYSFYPIDVHTEDGLDDRPLPRGVVPTTPYGALVPVRGRNIVAAGRCISGDREAFSAYRVQATCMGTGQAAGAATALAVRGEHDVEETDRKAVCSLLAEHGAILPPAAGEPPKRVWDGAGVASRQATNDSCGRAWGHGRHGAWRGRSGRRWRAGGITSRRKGSNGARPSATGVVMEN